MESNSEDNNITKIIAIKGHYAKFLKSKKNGKIFGIKIIYV